MDESQFANSSKTPGWYDLDDKFAANANLWKLRLGEPLSKQVPQI